MRALSVATTVALAALYASPAVANKQPGKVQFKTFCTQKLADPKCALMALSLFNYPHILPPVANLPLGLKLIQKPRHPPIYE